MTGRAAHHGGRLDCVSDGFGDDRSGQSAAMVSCDHCGTTEPDQTPPLTWSLSMEDGRVRRYCQRCTREHVRSMEGKLDPAHW